MGTLTLLILHSPTDREKTRLARPSRGLSPPVLDAGLIAAAQKVEQYEIAGYGCVRNWARLLGHEQAVILLQYTLDEEGQPTTS
jgi:hypothetical protein